MANWCYNHVAFTGSAEALDGIRALFTEILTKQEQDHEWFLPPYVTAENSHMLDIDIGEKGIEYSTRWTPNLEAVIQIAEHFNAGFTHRYDEPMNFVIGEATFRHGMYEHVSLDPADAGICDHWNDPAKVAELLEDRRRVNKAIRAAELYRSTGDMSPDDLREMYGGLTPGDLVLKLAQYKNFDAARKMFNTWDEAAVNEMDSLFIQNHRHPESLFKTEDGYIAVCFLKELISEWDKNNLAKLAQQRQAELVAVRLAGKLPHIDINGTDFTIDVRLKELRETVSPWNRLEYSEQESSLDHDDYTFFYDTKKHNIWELDDNLTEMPENVVLVSMPNEMILDPVAAARSAGYEETKFLDEFPIQPDLKATVTQLAETFLPQFIRDNLEKQNTTRGCKR
jgi:hypothetical protein